MARVKFLMNPKPVRVPYFLHVHSHMFVIGLNEHPFKNEPNARLICNFLTGGPIKADSLCTVMKQLRSRIVRLLESSLITDDSERQKAGYLVKTKKWNLYCIRHSAITSDSDFLPEYALKKKVRWSMNSKQGARYTAVKAKHSQVYRRKAARRVRKVFGWVECYIARVLEYVTTA